METTELVARLDAYFRTDDYPASDFDIIAQFSKDAGVPLADFATAEFMGRYNGLMLRNSEEVERVYTLVFPSDEVLMEVIWRASGRPAMVFTHHPMDFETSTRGMLPIGTAMFERLSEAGVSFYSAHAPLDCHETISTSRSLAAAVGVEIDGPAGEMDGLTWGVEGRVPSMPLGDFIDMVREACGVDRVDSKQMSERVERVAVIAGGAAYPGLMEDALARGCDTYLTGDFRVRHGGAWADENRAHLDAFVASVPLNLVGGSHYATESLVLRNEMLHWFRDLGLTAEFVPQTDPWR